MHNFQKISVGIFLKVIEVGKQYSRVKYNESKYITHKIVVKQVIIEFISLVV